MPWSRQPLPIIGKTFGQLTVLREIDTPRNSGRRVIARCSCGTEKTFFAQNIRRGLSTNCGCTRYTSAARTHGKSHTPEHRAWSSMITRCTNPKSSQFNNYGGRGITVCERWRSFAAFFEDVGSKPSPSHSLDRIDTNGNYEPGNVRWATARVQAQNKRDTVLVTHNGTTLTLCEWAEQLSIRRGTLYYRLYIAGWSIADSLETPTGVSANQYTGRGPR